MSTLQITSADEVLREVDEFFMKTGPVYEALHKLAERLSREGIDYALIGGMARVARFRAAYTDIDLIMTPEGLERFAKKLFRVDMCLPSRALESNSETAKLESREVITTGEYPAGAEGSIRMSCMRGRF